MSRCIPSISRSISSTSIEANNGPARHRIDGECRELVSILSRNVDQQSNTCWPMRRARVSSFHLLQFFTEHVLEGNRRDCVSDRSSTDEWKIDRSGQDSVLNVEEKDFEERSIPRQTEDTSLTVVELLHVSSIVEDQRRKASEIVVLQFVGTTSEKIETRSHQ